jgi:cytochrome P450
LTDRLGVQYSDAYQHPEEFRPGRFLDKPPPPYTLIPLGGGVRRCVGAIFAVIEIKTVLRTTLERVQLRAASQEPERSVRWRRFTVTPRRGGRVIPDGRCRARPAALNARRDGDRLHPEAPGTPGA